MAAKSFQADVNTQPDQNLAVIKFSGPMDESSKLPELDMAQIASVQIETGEISYINSIGIQHLIQWLWALEKARPQVMILFKNIPPILGKHFAVLIEHFPKRTVFGSLHVPYFCEDCEFECDHLIVLQRDCQKNAAGEIVVRDPPMCASCRVEMKSDPLFQSQVLSTFFKYDQRSTG